MKKRLRKQDRLWQRMAAMTLAKCKQTCRTQLGGCCDVTYCEMAKEQAKDAGVELHETGNAIPFLGPAGQCVVPPCLRQLCSLHQCKINDLGCDPTDLKWTKEYFQLRTKLDV